MNVNEVERIKEIINRAELESAKSEGKIETIKKEWKKNYGTDDVNEIKKIKAGKEEELKKTEERKKIVYDKIISCNNWDDLEEELA